MKIFQREPLQFYDLPRPILGVELTFPRRACKTENLVFKPSGNKMAGEIHCVRPKVAAILGVLVSVTVHLLFNISMCEFNTS